MHYIFGTIKTKVFKSLLLKKIEKFIHVKHISKMNTTNNNSGDALVAGVNNLSLDPPASGQTTWKPWTYQNSFGGSKGTIGRGNNRGRGRINGSNRSRGSSRQMATEYKGNDKYRTTTQS